MPDEQESPVVEESAGGDPVAGIPGETPEEINVKTGLVDRAMNALGMGSDSQTPEATGVEAAPASLEKKSERSQQSIQSENAEVKRRRKYGK